MHITSVKTDRITAGAITIFRLLDTALPLLQEESVVAITSKVISLCENNVVPSKGTDKEALAAQASDFYLPGSFSKFNHRFTITANTLISSAGIDSSNTGGYYVLWPKDAQKSANEIRHYLTERFGLRHVGVIITDSTSQPFRRGAVGITLAHSGFRALNSYVGTPDLFGHPFAVSQANVAEGLGAAAVLQMGEGIEQTPVAIITDLPFVGFQDRAPLAEELEELTLTLENDLFEPFLSHVPWRKGGRAPGPSRSD